MLITRKIEFDAGHRIPDHRSLCRNVHGHRYILEVTVEGDLNTKAGASDSGMVVDFGELKQMMVKTIDAKWDHSFLVYEGDKVALKALKLFGPKHRTVVLPVIPTVENLVGLIAEQLEEAMRKRKITAYELYRVKLWETPNCYAEWTKYL